MHCFIIEMSKILVELSLHYALILKLISIHFQLGQSELLFISALEYICWQSQIRWIMTEEILTFQEDYMHQLLIQG